MSKLPRANWITFNSWFKTIAEADAHCEKTDQACIVVEVRVGNMIAGAGEIESIGFLTMPIEIMKYMACYEYEVEDDALSRTSGTP